MPLRSLLACSVILASSMLAVGCSGDTQKQLQAPLEGIAKITLGDQVEAVCAGGDTMTVPNDEIGLNVIGMGDVESMTKVAKKIQTFCDTKEKERRVASSQLKHLDELIDGRKLKIDGDDVDAKRETVCAELALTLPVDADERTSAVNLNRNTYGCEDPGKPEDQPQKGWSISHDPSKRWATAKLELDDGKSELTFRCKQKDLKVYVKTGERMRKGKVTAKLDRKKAKWKVKTSPDKKYIFLPSPKTRARELAKTEKLTLTYKNARKKTRRKTFPTDGFDTALGVLKRYCKI
jgi:hypothetical protein